LIVGHDFLWSQAPISNQNKGELMMNKKMVAFAMALVFALSTAGLGFAAKLKCTVDGVEGDKVTMTCEGADKLKKDDKVKVATAKKGAVEGC
jgi:hypothetical protein